MDSQDVEQLRGKSLVIDPLLSVPNAPAGMILYVAQTSSLLTSLITHVVTLIYFCLYSVFVCCLINSIFIRCRTDSDIVVHSYNKNRHNFYILVVPINFNACKALVTRDCDCVYLFSLKEDQDDLLMFHHETLYHNSLFPLNR